MLESSGSDGADNTNNNAFQYIFGNMSKSALTAASVIGIR